MEVVFFFYKFRKKRRQCKVQEEGLVKKFGLEDLSDWRASLKDYKRKLRQMKNCILKWQFGWCGPVCNDAWCNLWIASWVAPELSFIGHLLIVACDISFFNLCSMEQPKNKKNIKQKATLILKTLIIQYWYHNKIHMKLKWLNVATKFLLHKSTSKHYAQLNLKQK